MTAKVLMNRITPATNIHEASVGVSIRPRKKNEERMTRNDSSIICEGDTRLS